MYQSAASLLGVADPFKNPALLLTSSFQQGKSPTKTLETMAWNITTNSLYFFCLIALLSVRAEHPLFKPFCHKAPWTVAAVSA